MKITSRLALKKYQSHIVTGVIVLGVLTGVVWTGWSSTTPEELGGVSPSGGALTADERSYNFGTISMAAGKVAHTFKVRNTSNALVTMKKLSTSCMCTTAALKHAGQVYGPYGMPGHGIIPTFSEVMNPGEEAEVEVTFDPAAHGPAGVGRISRVVYLETTGGPRLEFKFNAAVRP